MTHQKKPPRLGSWYRTWGAHLVLQASPRRTPLPTVRHLRCLRGEYPTLKVLAVCKPVSFKGSEHYDVPHLGMMPHAKMTGMSWFGGGCLYLHTWKMPASPSSCSLLLLTLFGTLQVLAMWSLRPALPVHFLNALPVRGALSQLWHVLLRDWQHQPT